MSEHAEKAPQAKAVETENEAIILEHANDMHPHHKKVVLCKPGVQSVTLGPSIYGPSVRVDTEQTYVRTKDTRDGMPVFRKANG